MGYCIENSRSSGKQKDVVVVKATTLKCQPLCRWASKESRHWNLGGEKEIPREACCTWIRNAGNVSGAEKGRVLVCFLLSEMYTD